MYDMRAHPPPLSLLRVQLTSVKHAVVSFSSGAPFDMPLVSAVSVMASEIPRPCICKHSYYNVRWGSTGASGLWQIETDGNQSEIDFR